MERADKLNGSSMQFENIQARQDETMPDGPEKIPRDAYVADVSGSHRKSKEERALVTKVDLVIVPLAALLYFVAYLDRNSIGNARILGMQDGLSLSNQRWSICLSMFFVGYVVCMLPGSIALRVIGPHRQLGGAAILFGTLLACMSAANNYATVVVLRILIGVAQAFIQGLTLYISLWYKRDEVATRAAIIYWAATISGAFSGFIAYGIGKNLTAETTDRDSWRWLFIIEGIIAISAGITVWFMLPHFPDSLKRKTWLFSPEQVAIAQARSASYNTAKSKISFTQLIGTLKDPKAWAYAGVNGGISIGISTIGLFLPTFIHAFGYSPERTQLFTVIPYACASVVIPISIVSDRCNMKGPFLLGTLILSCVGYIVLLCDVSVASNVVAVCLTAMGLYPSIILLQAWLVANIAGYTKRATTWAMVEVFGQCFGIVGSYVYNNFTVGHSIVLGLLVLAIALTVFLIWWMRGENMKRDAIVAEYERQGRIHPHRTRSLEEEQDLHIDYRYIL